MSRKHSNFGHDILPDPKFGSEMITRFVNMVMHSGEKSVAERIVYGALDTIEEKNKSAAPAELVEAALENVSPMVEVKSRRLGGATYQVPVEVRPSRRNALAMRWLVEYSRGRGEKSMRQRLAGEIIESTDAIVDDPSIVNTDPRGAGWFFKMKLTDPSSPDDLMDEDAYNALIA